MHYIIGTKISIGRRPTPDPRNPQSYRNRNLYKTGEFKPGKTYVLYHIVKDKDDMMRYVFISNNNDDVVGMIFNSIAEADATIAGIKNENLPDYNEIYSRNTS